MRTDLSREPCARKQKRIRMQRHLSYISIDPVRDTPQKAHQYATTFHKEFLGLSGNFEQADHASKQFRVYYSKAPNDIGPEEYLVDHTIVIYLIKPDGEFDHYFLQKKSSVEIGMYMLNRMQEWEEEQLASESNAETS